MYRVFVIVLLALLTACTIQPIRDPRSPEVAAATQTARAVPPLPTVEPQIVPTVDLPTTTPEPECILVKGNISSDGRKLYHLPGMRNYNQVVIDEAAGERTFCSEQAAIDAGWEKAPR